MKWLTTSGKYPRPNANHALVTSWKPASGNASRNFGLWHQVGLGVAGQLGCTCRRALQGNRNDGDDDMEMRGA